MIVNLSEYKMILQAISDLEQIKKEAESEFYTYCLVMKCKECPMRDIECQTSTYLELRESGVIE